jgi:hypothetical protein
LTADTAVPRLGTAGQNRWRQIILFSGNRTANDPLNTALSILTRHESFERERSRTSETSSDCARKLIICGFAAKLGKDASFYTGDIGLEALDCPGDYGLTCSHDHRTLLDEHANIDQGHYEDRPILCNHTFAAVLGKGGRQVTRLGGEECVESLSI